MYELVKKKNIGFRILIGILILFAITTVLKMLLHEPRISVDGQLVKVANEINKNAPIVIDSATRLDHIRALPGRIFQYYYTLLMDKPEIDSVSVVETVKVMMIDMAKNNPKTSYLRDNEIVLQSIILDKNGTQIAKVTLLPEEYK